MRNRAILRALTVATMLAYAGAAAGGPPEGKPPQGKPDAQQDAATTEKARRLHIEGDAYFEKGDYARARAAYLEAWALKKHYRIAGNLGDAEAKLGLLVEAAEHLRYYVHNSPKDDPPPESAMMLYMETLAKISVMRIDVNADGAEILVDGRKIGTAPLPDTVTVLPGKHTVEARRGALVATQEVVLEANQVKRVYFGLPREQPGDAPAGLPPKQMPPKEPAPSDAAAPPEEGAKKSIVVLGAGVAVATVGVVIGAVMTTLANNKSALADDLRVGNGGPSECYGKESEDCRLLMDAVDGMDAFTGAAAVSFAIAGLAAGGTAAYMLLPMPWEKKAGEEKATGARATPWVGLHGGGVSVGGRF